MVDITIVNGVYKPTHITEGHHIVWVLSHFPVGLFTKNTRNWILCEDPKAAEQVAAPAPVHRSTVADWWPKKWTPT